MVGKIMRWLMRMAGLGDIQERLDRLEKGFVEIDSACVVDCQLIEELRDEMRTNIARLSTPEPKKPTPTQEMFSDMLTEYFYGYQPQTKERDE